MNERVSAKEVEITELADRRLGLSGDLTFETVTAAKQKLNPHFAGNSEVCFDFSDVDDVDSAGVALLLHLVQLSRQNGTQLKLDHLPFKMLHLMRVNGLNDVLPAAESAG